MASLVQWTRTWANLGRWWGTGRPGVLQSMWSQRVKHAWVTEQQQPSFPNTLNWRHYFLPIEYSWLFCHELIDYICLGLSPVSLFCSLDLCVGFVPVPYYCFYLFVYLFFCHTILHAGAYFPNQESNLCPLQLKHGVLTTGVPGKSVHHTALITVAF